MNYFIFNYTQIPQSLLIFYLFPYFERWPALAEPKHNHAMATTHPYPYKGRGALDSIDEQ
ncbi:hypothetical protein Scep_016464 [Stephania cephalantha]|uniref:Uncharacterized protein n=1 Tax=Stephania cephalantha TaxID=152367 RepID=A0AAP0IMR4_9MAGN